MYPKHKQLGQPDEVHPRSPGRRYIPGTKGIPSISILVISRGYHQLPRYRENSAQTLFRVNPGLRQKNPGPKDGTDRWSANNEYPIGTVQCYFFHQFTPLRWVQGLQCSAYDMYFIYKSDAFLRRVSVLGTAKWTDFCVSMFVLYLLYCLYISFNVNVI